MGTVSDRGAARDSQLPFLPSPPIAPESALGGTALTAAMAQRLVSLHPSSGAETLQALRRAFPDSPLTLRVAALNMIMRGLSLELKPNGRLPHAARSRGLRGSPMKQRTGQ